MMKQRPFSTGSGTSESFDSFLQQNGLYRKHIARDSSCLFRAISEQMYCTQIHHARIRQSCVDYMREYKEYFKNSYKLYNLNNPNVNFNFDEYLVELSKSETFGTMVELEAMAYMFTRNILLFRPMNRGNYFIYKPDFERNFEIFVRGRFFDAIYPTGFIKDVAFCQSIVYDILYTKVFQMPDVTYAVERMLYPSTFQEVKSNDGLYCRRIELKDGRSFDLDRPETTRCILNNYELCHFHNPNFPQLSEASQRGYDFYNLNNYPGRYNGLNYYQNHGATNMDVNNFCNVQGELRLPHKYISCVRQLLARGLVPFPFRAAKALDPDTYRNIEFDSWRESKKEICLNNWITAGYNLQVGAKCQVYLEKYNSFFMGVIQEVLWTSRSIVFIEALGEKLIVPSECLKPLPSDQTKPWPLPYPWKKQFEKEQDQQHTQSKLEMVEFKSCDITHTFNKNGKEEINVKVKRHRSLESSTTSNALSSLGYKPWSLES